jgi:hypothetical protein
VRWRLKVEATVCRDHSVGQNGLSAALGGHRDVIAQPHSKKGDPKAALSKSEP